MIKRVVQVMFLLVGGTLGVLFLPYLFQLSSFTASPLINNPYATAVLGALILFVFSTFLTDPIVNFIKWLEDLLMKAPILDLLFGSIGLIIGLIVAFLVGSGLNSLEIPVVTSVLPILLVVLLGYLGFQVGFQKRDEFVNAIISLFNVGRKKEAVVVKDGAIDDTSSQPVYKVLDTSVIIDGRIADIVDTGFLEGVLVVSQFVLTELQHIADSADTLKRTKGRRGLDVLRRLQEGDGKKI